MANKKATGTLNETFVSNIYWEEVDGYARSYSVLPKSLQPESAGRQSCFADLYMHCDEEIFVD